MNNGIMLIIGKVMDGGGGAQRVFGKSLYLPLKVVVNLKLF